MITDNNIFLEEFKKYSQKEKIKNIPISSLKKHFSNKKILSERKIKIRQRPTWLVQSERFYSTYALRLYEKGKLKLTNITEIDFPEKTKQLGEKAQIYGKVLSRAEAMIHAGTYTLNTESLVITSSWRKFTEGLTASERRDLIRYRDYFIRILIYVSEVDKIIVQERPFIMINFSYRSSDGRLINLKNLEDIHDLASIETIELRLNREVYGCLVAFLAQKQEKKEAIGGGGVRESTIENLPDILTERLKFYKPLILAQCEIDKKFLEAYFQGEKLITIQRVLRKTKYNDKMRIAFERIIDFYFTGEQKRKAETIDFEEEIYDLLFISERGGNYIRYAFIIMIFNIVLNDIENPSLFLTIEKHGKSRKKLKADLNLGVL